MLFCFQLSSNSTARICRTTEPQQIGVVEFERLAHVASTRDMRHLI